jgi:hypothetical protein
VFVVSVQELPALGIKDEQKAIKQAQVVLLNISYYFSFCKKPYLLINILRTMTITDDYNTPVGGLKDENPGRGIPLYHSLDKIPTRFSIINLDGWY